MRIIKVRACGFWTFWLILPVIPAAAQSTVVIGFDTLQCAEFVNDYFAGGFGSLGSGPGPDYGITFSSNAQVQTDSKISLPACASKITGGQDTTNMPSPSNAMLFQSGSAATMNVAAGFTGGFSFYYAAPFYPGSVTVWSGLNGTGTLLASLTLPINGKCSNVPYYCVWSPIGVSFSGTAQSVNFGGSTDYIIFDSITLGVSLVVNPAKSSGNPSNKPGSCSCGDPVSVGTGNLFEQVNEYQTSGANVLGFTRYYNSLSTATFATTLGVNWRGTYDRYIRINSSTSVTVERDDGQQANFNLIGSTWTPDTDVDLQLTTSGSSWILKDSADTTETYATISAAEGLLSSITARNGYSQSLHYNGSDQLISVTDSYNRTLSFAYLNGLLNTLTTPDGLVLTYSYTSSGANNRLASVSYSTSPETSQSYVYENSSFPFNLTGVIDEDGNRYATWTYDQFGRVLTSQHAGGADLTTFAYNDTNGSRTVTNALGQVALYIFTTLQGVPKLTQIERQATATTTAATRAFTYDGNGYVASQTDWDGNLTTYVNDIHGQPTTINEAVGTPQARATTITYLSNYHLPSQIVTAGLTTNFTYDGSGDLLTKTQTDTTTSSAPYSTNGQHRTWTYAWANFLLASALGPRTDISELVKFTYDSTGALAATTNALGQLTKITEHLPGGLPQIVVDPNGVTTALGYDARLRLLTSTVTTSTGPLITKYAYDAAGNLLSVTLPDGSALTNVYDAAHRLIGMVDLLRNTIAYILDAAGDRIETLVSNPAVTITREHSATFDVLGRLLHDIGGVGQTTAYGYDANGNALTVTDPLQRLTQQSFDALNRATQVTNPIQGKTTTTYDAHDRPISVTDPNGNTTAFAYDGFGDLIQEVSPARGTTVYHYDLDGNLVQKVDARGAIANYTYDALDRVTASTYPADTGENVTYTYDQASGGFGIGRLTSVTDAAGTLTRTYDERGNLLNENRQFSIHGQAAAAGLRGSSINRERISGTREESARANAARSGNSTSTAAPGALDHLVPRLASSAQTTISFSGQEVTKTNPGTVGCTNPPPATSFFTSDAAVYLYFNATTTLSDNLTNDWLAPDGSVVTGASWQAISGLYCYTGASLTIDPNTGPSRLGTWQARVYDNGAILFSVPFTLTIATPAPGISYTYDAASRIVSITYPSHLTTIYVRDIMGRVPLLTARAPGATATTPILSTIGYQPFGPPDALTYGNGIIESRSFDLDYRLTTLSGTGNNSIQRLSYGYNAANDVLSITDAVMAGNSQNFGYDVLDRLTSASGAYGTLGYTYDANGNRLTENPAAPVALDGLGSITGLAYNQAGRLASTNTGTQQITQYTYDGFGRRVAKVGNVTATTLFQYDGNDHLLEETDAQGNAKADYIYLDARPVAELSAGKLYFLHDDRLGTPQVATDPSQAAVWVGNYQPFGTLTSSSQTALLGQDLRLPGQENDLETGLYHNGFRDYVPALGRYLRSDPIGPSGGTNTYLYARGNPIASIDPDGLSYLSEQLTGAESAFWALGFSALTITKGFTQPLDALNGGAPSWLHDVNGVVTAAQEEAAARLLASTASGLHVTVSQADVQTDAQEITNIGDLTYSVGSIYMDAPDIAELQSTITINSWLGESITWPVLKQAYSVVSLSQDITGALTAAATFLRSIQSNIPARSNQPTCLY